MTGPCEPTVCVLVFSHRGVLTSSPVSTSLRSHTMYSQQPHYTDQWFRNTREGTTWWYLFICAQLNNRIINWSCTTSTRNGKLFQIARQKRAMLDFPVEYFPYGGPGSVVGTATGYRLDGPGIESRWWRDFPHLSKRALGLTCCIVDSYCCCGVDRHCFFSCKIVVRTVGTSQAYFFVLGPRLSVTDTICLHFYFSVSRPGMEGI
jgi:hypothetical protein